MSITPDYYDEEYYTKGTKSHYGYQGLLPYTHQAYLLLARKRALAYKFMFNPIRALVVGCALGYLVQALREVGVEAYGVDISRWAIDHADETVKPYLTRGDACDMHFYADGSFDLVIAENVLEHIPMPGLLRAISECCRVCSEIFLFDAVTRDDGIDKSHVSIFPIEWWIRQVEIQGFRLLYKKRIVEEHGLEKYVLIFRRAT